MATIHLSIVINSITESDFHIYFSQITCQNLYKILAFLLFIHHICYIFKLGIIFTDLNHKSIFYQYCLNWTEKASP